LTDGKIKGVLALSKNKPEDIRNPGNKARQREKYYLKTGGKNDRARENL